MKNKLKFDSYVLNRVLIGLIALLIICSIFGTNAIVGQLKTKSNALVELKAKSQALNQEQTNLISAKKEVAKYSSLETIAEAVVPQDKNQAEAVREIVNLAQANGIALSAISFPSSTLGVPTSTTSTSPAATSVSLSQLTPVKGIPGVYTLPIEIDDTLARTAVNYSAFYNFLSSLEQNRRTSQVTGLNIQPLPGGLITFSLTISEYIKPS